ncbi:MAG: efflux RND transporter permease subunit [Gammaproteobacteria bacterium]|jgi:predicted RND superfamily exporter protein
MHQFEIGFAQRVLSRRWWIIAITLVLVAAAATGGQHLHFNSSYRVFFGPDNPQRIAFEELENTYVKNDTLLIVIAPGNHNVFSNGSLAVVEDVTRRAWQIPYSNRVDSVTNFQHTEANNDELIVRPLVRNAGQMSPEEIARVRRIALAEPLLRDSLIREDAEVTGVFVNVQLPGKSETAENAEIILAARALAADVEQTYPGTKIYLTGMVMMNNAFPEATTADLKTLIPLSALAMVALLAVFVGGVAGTFGAVLVFSFSIIGALGLSGYFGYPVTPVSASAPTIILTVAIANCVHILANYLFELRHNLDCDAALQESLRVNLQPIIIASVTTAIGFLTLNFSEVPPFQHLGNIVAVGVLLSMVLSVTFLPSLISVLPTRTPAPRDDDARLIVMFGEFVVRRRSALLWVTGVTIILLVVNVPRNELNDVFLHWFDESIQFRADTDFATEHLSGLYTTEYSLRAAEAGGISDPGFLRDAEAFANWMRSQNGVRHVRTYTDIMKRLNKNLHGDAPAQYRLPAERELAAQYLLLYEMSLPYGLDLNNQINVDKSSVRVTVTTDVLSTREILTLNDAAGRWLDGNAPHIDALPASGTVAMFANIAARNIRAMIGGTTIALVLISLILVVALRSRKIGLLSLIPNLAPAAMGFGLWGLFVGEVGLSLSIVMSMTLGIVIDDTVHFLSKYLRARREQGLDSADAVRYAFKTVGKALVVTSIVLVAGFSILALSKFANNADVGLLTAVIIALALVADFLFLPPLLMAIDGQRTPS